MTATRRAILLSGLVAFAPQAHADIGVPMVAFFLPPMWLSLVPVILLEGWILRRMLRVDNRSAFTASAIANIATTIVGIPLAWVVLAIAELACCGGAGGLATLWQRIYAVTVQAPWLIPYEKDLDWMVPSAMAVLAVPFFLVTVVIEGLINRRLLPNVDRRKTWRATWVANAASYVMLLLLAWPAFAVAGILRGVFRPLLNWFVEVVFTVARFLVGA